MTPIKSSLSQSFEHANKTRSVRLIVIADWLQWFSRSDGIVIGQ